jgi:hypothetical protein
MSKSPNLGFGAFLIGLGGGWLVFRVLDITRNVFAWLVILAGVAILASSLISWQMPEMNIGGLVGGLMGGLILSLFITSGFSFFTGGFDFGTVGDYRASDTTSYTGMMTAENVYLKVDNFNGPIRVSTWGKGEYSIEVTVKAKGTTTKEAEQNLEDYTIEFEESTVSGQGRLVLDYDIPATWTSRYAVEVEVFLPSDASIDLDLVSSNGAISLKDITGETLTLTTSNGQISLDEVYAERIDGGTSNARITGRLEAPDTSLSTSNGVIDLTLPCTVIGRYDLVTSNAGIDIKVSSSADVGYSLNLSTSNGSVDFDLPNLSYTINQKTRKVAKTTGFDDKEIRITITGSTSNSGVDVND